MSGILALMPREQKQNNRRTPGDLHPGIVQGLSPDLPDEFFASLSELVGLMATTS
jgi:hypothetical protein